MSELADDAPASSSDTARLGAGDRVGEWTLEAAISNPPGEAATRVFRAAGPGGSAAIKVFAPAATHAAAAEAGALSTLEHPSFPRLLARGQPPAWLALEWIDGQPLSAALTPGNAAALAAQLLGALSHAHSRGILHGDLRPENILVEPSGRLVVIDLGLGGPTDRLDARHATVSGTPAYLAPERIAGGPPSPAADLHAAGALLVDCLCGSAGLDALRAGRLGKIPWPQELADALRSVILGLVGRDPDRRPASAGEALEHLLPLLDSPLPRHLAHLPADARLRPATASAEPAEPPIIGREAALGQIDAMLRATREGRGTFVVVAADAGLGRTRLLQEVASRCAGRGVRPLVGRCRQAADRGPWREVLLGLATELATRTTAEIADLVTADARALGLACPEMLDLPYVRTLPDPADLSPDLNKFRVFSAVTALLRNWSRKQPLVLVVDDIQWADDATLELLYYLQRNVVHGAATFGEAGAGGALSIVVARRSSADRPPALLERTLADARRGAPSLEIMLQRLAPDQLRDLVTGMLPGSPVPRELSDLVAAESGGSPQVAVELIRSLHAEGLVRRVKGEWRFAGTHGSPSGQLADMLTRRLERVDRDARRLLVAAAVAGQDFDVAVAAEAAELPAADAEAAALQLLAARLVLASGADAGRCTFVHEQLRHLVLDDLEAGERAARHLAVARALARRGATSAELARHHVAAGDALGALEHLPKAAADARAAGNPAEALSLLRAHVALFDRLPREDRRRRADDGLAARRAIAEILQRIGRYDEASAAWIDLLGACRSAGDLGAEASALVGLGMTLNLAGDYGEAREHLERALALAEERDLPLIAASARVYLVQNAYMRGRFEEGEIHVAAVRTAVRSLDDRALTAEALRQIGLFHHFRGRSDDAIPLYREALQLLGEVGDRATIAKTLHNLGIMHNARGEHDVAVDCYERSLAIFREMGMRIEQAKCLSNMGNIHLQQGGASEAERCYLQAQAIYHDLEDRRSEAENLSNLGEVDSKRGRWLRARERHRQALAVHRDLGNPAGIAYACYELAMTHLALGRIDEARPLVKEALERDREIDNPRGLAYDLAASALLQHDAGDDEAALSEYRLALDEARRAGDRYHAALLLGDLAWQLVTMGRARDALAPASQAHLEATSLGARELEVTSLLAQARAGGSDAAKDRLERALELAQRTENPEIHWRAWHCAALLRRDRGERPAAAIDRAVDLIDQAARGLGVEAAGFLTRRDVRRLLDDFLDLEERSGARAESVLARYHLLATDEQRIRAKGILAAVLGGPQVDSSELRRLRRFHVVVTTQDVLSLDSLLAAFMERIVASVDADRGLLYLLRGHELACRIAIGRGGRVLAAPERDVPRQVVDWVMRERAGLVTEDASTDGRIAWKDSIADLRVRSLLAAPLLEALAGDPANEGGGEILGVVYVDRRATGAPFPADLREDFEATCADLARLIGIALRAEAGIEEARRARSLAAVSAEGLPGLLGISAPMERLFATARIAAASNASVLVTGASGTGKEGLARALHVLSPRTKGPFVAIDCGSIPATLIESVLFGHVRGAFTGADRDRPGLFEEADRGTLFLDEITNASIDLQARLLRVLQEREIRRVGGRGTIPVDVRVIAATNLDLEKEVEEGRFRQDLYYRLNVIHMHLPSLAERPEDIPVLAEHFLAQVVERDGKQLEGFTEEALRVLRAHPWPGNVRELANCVARMAAFCTEGRVGIDRIPETIRAPTTRSLDLRVPKDGGRETDAAVRVVQSMATGQGDFWSAVRAPLRDRTMTRTLAVEIVAEGLRRTAGSYRATAALFGLPADDYGRFMDFLRFNKLKLDFRDYRQKK